ncbi:MAG: ammonium transporter [Halieaceae bacterium]|jgi:Amt family ammonium transporter|nr:ammonium transporter [Halieaceae bacterium]
MQIMIWLCLSTFLVIVMQAGFACLEAGLVRSKNSINVAIKNVADFGTSVVLFMALGFPLMFGPSTAWSNGLVGWTTSPLLVDDPVGLITALFQALFAGTAVTIVSGAVAERMAFRGYLVLAAVVPVCIYPFPGHWIWGSDGWLQELGFRDVAGGTVVHVVGGAIALAAALVIGPRLGRFESSRAIESSNLAVAALGAFLLMFGWFGFNSGASTSLDREVPLILANTAIAGSMGIVTGIAVQLILGRQPTAQSLFTGMLGGLVGVTAGCSMVAPVGAMILGVLAGLTALAGVHLLERLRIDDPVSAIPVHLGAGVLGTVLLPILAVDAAVPDGVSGRLHWMLVQSLGTATAALFAFAATWVFLRLTSGLVRYRVGAADERMGLNIAEHGAHSSLFELLDQMAAQGVSGDFSAPINAEPETEASYVAVFYNGVRERFLKESSTTQTLLEESRHQAMHDTLTGLYNRRAFYDRCEARRAEVRRHGGESAIIMLDVDHFKSINDGYGHNVGDEVLVEIARRLSSVARDSDTVARVGGEEIAILATHLDLTNASELAARLRLCIADRPFTTSAGELRVTASFGVAIFDAAEGVGTSMKACDTALYEAKRRGRNRVVAQDADTSGAGEAAALRPP